MALITTTDLENAKLDAVSLGEFVNNDQVVTTRTSQTYNSIRRTLNAINSVTRAYATKTALIADLTPVDKTLGYALDTEKFYIKSGGTGTGSWSEGAYASIKGTNILYDTWNKKTQNSLNLGGWNWYRGGTPSFTASRTNIPTDTPKVAVTGTIFDKQWDLSKLNLKDGDTISIGALVWSETVKLRIVAYIKNSSDVTTTTVTPSYDTGAGLRIITNQFVIPADADKSRLHIRIQAQSSVAFEIGAISAAVGNYLAPFNEVDAFTDYEKVALGVTAIETKTNNITVTQAVNLDTIESDTAASKTKTDFITVTQAVNLDTIESDILSLQTNIRQPNILYDSWNKKTETNINLGGFNWWNSITPTFTTSATNIPTTTPKVAVTGTLLTKLHPFPKLNLRTGDVVTVAALVWSASVPMRLNCFIRNSSNTTIFSDNSSYDAVTGMRIITNTFTVPADADKAVLSLQVQAQSSASFEVAAYSAAVGNYIASFTDIADVDYDKVFMGVSAIETNITEIETDIGTIQSDIVALQNNTGLSPNIYPDPFSETVTSGKQDDIFGRPGINSSFDTIESASPNTPFAGKRTLKAIGAGLLRKYINYNILGIKNGEDFKVRIIAHYAGTGSITISLRNSAGSVLQSFTRSSITAGLIDYTTNAFQGNADGSYLFFEIVESNDMDRELIAIAVSKGQGTPEISYFGTSPTLIKSLSNLKNLCPDPFFRRYSAGETLIDGFSLGAEETASWEIVDFASSPFKTKKAQYFAPASSYSQRYIDVKNFGLRLGQQYTVTLGIIAPVGGSFDLGAWFRNAETDDPITSTSTTRFTLLDNQYTEISRTVTITQELIDTPIYLVVRHNAANTNFTQGYYICAWAVYEGDVGQEIVDENYAIDAVNLRVKSLEDAQVEETTQDVYTYGEYRLRETKQRLQKLDLGETAQLNIAIHGTSTTQLGTRYVTPLTTELVSEYGDAGGGWLGFGFTATPTSNGNSRSSIYTYARTGTWTSDYYASLSADMSTVESSTAGSRLTIAGPAGTPVLSGIDLHWVATTNGVIRYSWNGGSSWTTLNVQGTVNTVNITSLSGFPTTGNFSLIIEVVSGSVILSGVNIKSSASGVVVHKLGNSGGRLQHVAEINNTEWIKTIINLAPNVFFIFHGGNDQNAGRTPTQFADNLRTVIDRIKVAIPACDIGIIMPPAVVEPRTPPLALYTFEALKVSKEKKVAFIDLQKVFGDDPSEYASDSPRPWFNADDVHPEPSTGGRAIVSALYRFIKY